MTTDTTSGSVAASPRDTYDFRSAWRRLWLPAVLLAGLWAYLYALDMLAMPAEYRFPARILPIVLVVLLFLGWWMFTRHLTRRERWIPLVQMLIVSVLSVWLTDKSVGIFGMLITGLPILLALWTVWLFVALRTAPALKLGGLAALPVLVLIGLMLVRGMGLNGRRQASFALRWTPTAEEVHLQEIADRAGKPAVDDEVVAAVWTPQAGDWLNFRGPQTNSTAAKVVATDWREKQPSQVWRCRVGPAWSSMIVVDGHLVTQEQRGEDETVVCLDAATGKELWAYKQAARYENSINGAGPRGTPAFAQGKIIAQGAEGKLNCVNASDGKLVWQHDLLKEADASLPMWGHSSSPLVVDDRVVVFVGGAKSNPLIAFQIADGARVWSAGQGAISYSSPELLTIDGVRQIVMYTNEGVQSFNSADGKLLWELPGDTNAEPMLQPQLIADGKLLVEWNGGIAVCDVAHDGEGWSAKLGWKSTGLKPGFNDFVVHKGSIYGLDDGILCCVDLATGKRLWKGGRYQHGQVLLLPEADRLVVISETGDLVLVATNPKKHEELGQFQAIEGKTWNHPVAAHGKLFVRNGEEMVCYQLEER